MASWNAGTKVFTIASTDTAYTTASIISTIANTTYADTLLSGGDTPVYKLNDMTIYIENGGAWDDSDCIILHTVNRADYDAIEFQGATAKVEWGALSSSASALAPITQKHDTTTTWEGPVHYSFISNNSSQTWTNGGAGILRMYGGLLRFRDANDDGYNETYTVEFPTTECKLIQVQCENIGSAVFDGTGYHIVESKFKKSENGGFDFQGSTTGDIYDVQFHKMDVALEFTDSGDVTARKIRFRGNTADLKVNGLTGDITLVDSDTISSLGTISFGTGGTVLEANSYNIHCVDSSLANLQNVRVLAYQKSSGGSTAYGAEKLTGSDGKVSEYIVSRYQYDSTHTTVVGRLDYGNAAVRLRKYDYKFMDIEKVPAEVGLNDKFIVNANSYTSANEATALAYTGISIDEGNSEIDLTEAHTIQEVYDYLQAKCAASGNMDLPELLKTKDGQSYTMPSTWSFTGLQYLDLGTKVIVGRYVPVKFTNIINGSKCAVVKVSDGTVLGSDTSSGTSLTVATEYENVNVYARARLAGYVPFVTQITLGTTGNNIVADMPDDEVYT